MVDDHAEGFAPHYHAAVADSRTRAQIGFNGWYADFPGAADFIDTLFSCRWFQPANSGNPNVSEFCDPTIDAQIRLARSLDTSDPARANLLWRHIDHLIVDKAPLVALANPSWAFIVSRRVATSRNNRAHSPEDPLRCSTSSG